MAAIISQIAANKRARAKSAHLEVSSDKCVYPLPPFDPCFDPLVHNKFMRAMLMKKEFELEKFVTANADNTNNNANHNTKGNNIFTYCGGSFLSPE